MARWLGALMVSLALAGCAGQQQDRSTAAPWLEAVGFRALPGWQLGSSGTTASLYGGAGKAVPAPTESTAWAARDVRYRDGATADPPNLTLAHLPASGVIVWAAIFTPAQAKQQVFSTTFSGATRHDCCEAAPVRGGEYELTGAGDDYQYSVIVRVYFGSRPTRAMRAEARHALMHLRLPPPRPPTGGVTVSPGQTRTFSKAELKPYSLVRCVSQGHTLTLTTPVAPGSEGEGGVATPRRARPFHAFVKVNPNGSYTVTCGYGGEHL